MNYWRVFRQWLTFWYALAAQFLLSRGDAIMSFRRRDYGGVLANLILVVLVYMPIVALFRYLYAKRREEQNKP
jgi:hypothetical protein